MIKKEYMRPATVVYTTDLPCIIAGSPGFKEAASEDDYVKEDEVLARENNPSAPNLWEQGW